MDAKSFEMAIGAGCIGKVVLFEDRVTSSWEVWAYPSEGDQAVFSAITGGSNVLTVQRGGARAFAGLDSAYRFVRLRGWKSSVEIDGKA